MAGLYIEHKANHRKLRWLSAFVFVLFVFVGGGYLYNWYVTGNKPPLIPLPATAMADPTVDESQIPQSAIDNYTVSASHPRFISIPALGITKTRVQVVGLTKNHALDTPRNISDTAWYSGSATPGQGYGAVLIDGHNGGVTRDGVFAHLDSLKNGDAIIITRGDGKQITYSVVENKTESVQEATTSGMKDLMTPYEPTKEGLGLITCAGNWVPRDKVFSERILVRAIAQ